MFREDIFSYLQGNNSKENFWKKKWKRKSKGVLWVGWEDEMQPPPQPSISIAYILYTYKQIFILKSKNIIQM